MKTDYLNSVKKLPVFTAPEDIQVCVGTIRLNVFFDS